MSMSPTLDDQLMVDEEVVPKDDTPPRCGGLPLDTSSSERTSLVSNVSDSLLVDTVLVPATIVSDDELMIEEARSTLPTPQLTPNIMPNARTKALVRPAPSSVVQKRVKRRCLPPTSKDSPIDIESSDDEVSEIRSVPANPQSKADRVRRLPLRNIARKSNTKPAARPGTPQVIASAHQAVIAAQLQAIGNSSAAAADVATLVEWAERHPNAAADIVREIAAQMAGLRPNADRMLHLWRTVDALVARSRATFVPLFIPVLPGLVEEYLLPTIITAAPYSEMLEAWEKNTSVAHGSRQTA